MFAATAGGRLMILSLGACSEEVRSPENFESPDELFPLELAAKLSELGSELAELLLYGQANKP
jgi:hypothetical protein